MKKVIDSSILPFIRRLSYKDQSIFFDLYLSTDEAGIVDIKGRGLWSQKYSKLIALREQIIIKDQLIIFRNYIKWNYSQLKENYNPHSKAWKAIENNGFTYDSTLQEIVVKDPHKFN